MTLRHSAFTLLGKLLGPAGVAVVKRDATTLVRRARFMDQAGITLVLDIGAAKGAYGRWIRSSGYTERIVSYEPLQLSFAELERQTADDPLWESKRLALGSHTGTAMLHVAGNQDSSSVLPMLDRHVREAPRSAPVGVEEVEVTTLDEQRALVGGDDVLMLKLDTQGNERAVLDGGLELLASVRLIEIELSLVPLYEGAPLWLEMIEYLEQLGLEPIWLERGFTARDGRLLQVDGIFARASD
ncbi:MAG TPA: FkbM family methyltransferase [Euzebya sp.]|nr:FkbM family methyltransferase [Euzebya sp.]